MISPVKMRELISKKKNIYILYWFCLSSRLSVVLVNLNEEYKINNDKLYYKNKYITDLDRCFEDFNLSVRRVNGALVDCDFIYSYDGLEDDVI